MLKARRFIGVLSSGTWLVVLKVIYRRCVIEVMYDFRNRDKSPLDSGIKAANSEATIGHLAGDVHLPQQLRIQLLGYFLDV